MRSADVVDRQRGPNGRPLMRTGGDPVPTHNLRTIESALERIAKLTDAAKGPLPEAATWVWPMGYERRQGERNGSSGGDVNRPTEAAVGHGAWVETYWATDGTRMHKTRKASREWVIRTETEHAGQWIMKAAALLEAAMGALDQASKAAGSGDQPESPRPEQLSRTATKAEVAKAVQMRRWRDQERTKGVGRGTY